MDERIVEMISLCDRREDKFRLSMDDHGRVEKLAESLMRDGMSVYFKYGWHGDWGGQSVLWIKKDNTVILNKIFTRLIGDE